MIVARILYAFLSAFSYPLQTLPLRIAISHMIPLDAEVKVRNRHRIYLATTVGILLATFIVAFFVDDLVWVSAVIGTFAGIPICYLLPFIFYIRLTAGYGWTRMRIAATFLALFGAASMLIGSFSLIFGEGDSL